MTEHERQTHENTIAITKMIGGIERTHEDVKKLITHLDQVPILRVESLEARVKVLEADAKRKTWYILTTLATIVLGLLFKNVI